VSAGRLLFVLPFLALSGCVATQKDMLELSSQTEDLSKQLGELKQTIGSLQANQAELAVSVKNLHQDLLTFSETMKDSQSQMSQLSAKLDDMGASVTNKVASIGESLSAAQAKAQAEQKAALTKQSPTELYQLAEVRLGKKDYELAAKGFEQYLEQFPKGALIDVAVYNLGESYFGMKKWEDAGRQFGLYLERYPKARNTPSARLLYALCLMNLKRNLDEAAQYLESIGADYPSSPEAKAAAKHLKKLEELAKKKG
jgi:tol-pal system protein YbgF